MHIQSNSFFIFLPLPWSSPQAPQLSEMAVKLINCNCNNIKTPVTLNIVPDLLVKGKFTVFIQEIKMAPPNQKGLSVSMNNFTFSRWITTGRRSKWKEDHLLFLRPSQMVEWEVCPTQIWETCFLILALPWYVYDRLLHFCVRVTSVRREVEAYWTFQEFLGAKIDSNRAALEMAGVPHQELGRDFYSEKEEAK